jgi:beta-lactamase class A
MPPKLIPSPKTGVAILLVWLSAGVFAQTATAPLPEKQAVLWTKLEESILAVDRGLDGGMGVAIVDLTDGHKYLLHADGVFPQASSIKICVLAELYRQAQ